MDTAFGEGRLTWRQPGVMAKVWGRMPAQGSPCGFLFITSANKINGAETAAMTWKRLGTRCTSKTNGRCLLPPSAVQALDFKNTFHFAPRLRNVVWICLASEMKEDGPCWTRPYAAPTISPRAIVAAIRALRHLKATHAYQGNWH